MIMINNSKRNIFDSVIGSHRQNEQLNDGHHKYRWQNSFVTEHLPELFLQQKFQRSHANLILNFLRLIPRRITVIPARMSVSFQIDVMPKPFSITSLIMI